MPTVVVQVAIGLALSAASYMVQKAIAPKERQGEAPSPLAAGAQPAEINQIRNLNIRQAVPPRQFVYGECRIGGIVFFEDNDNPYLYVGLAISDGECAAVTGVFFGGVQISMDAESPAGQAAAAAGTIFEDNFDLSYRLGTVTQTSDPLLAAFPTITSNFWQRGVTCCAVRLNWGDDNTEHSTVWGNSIEPSFSGQWRKVYDPRAGQTLGTPSTYAYSNNPALCVADALTNAWGVGLSTAHVDWSSVSAAADACDVTTTFGAASVPLFTLAGVFRSETDMASQIQAMLDSFRGRITYSDGQYKIIADAARSSAWTITDDDILEISEHTHGASSADAYNAIKALYADSDAADRETTTPVYDISATVVEGLRETAVRLPFTQTSHSAQILAYRRLLELRNGRRLAIRVHDAGLFLDAFEVVTIASTGATFINGTWQIDQIDIADVGVVLTLREYVSALYTDPTTYLQ